MPLLSLNGVSKRSAGRFSRAQRRGEDDDDAPDHAVLRARRGRHHAGRHAARRGGARGEAPHRLPGREQPAVRRDAGRGLPRLHRRPARAGGRESRPVVRRGRHRDGDRRGVLSADRRAVEGLPPARRAGAGDPPPARPVGPRRADGGPRPEPAGGDPPAHRHPGARPHGAALDPRALGGAAELLAPSDHQPRQDRGRRARGSPDRARVGCRRDRGRGRRRRDRAGAARPSRRAQRSGVAHGRRRARRPDPHRRPHRRPAARDLRPRESPRLDAVRAAPGDGEPGGAVPPAHGRRGGRDVKRGLRTAWTVARRELRTLFDQPTGYILLVVFVATNDFLFFRQAELYGVATLRPMLDLLPWLLLFLVPAVTMRALAEDARSGVLEVVLAQPITELELLLGKYVGQVLFLWIALVLTVAIPLGLTAGSHPQWGVVIAQYVGAGLLTLGLAGVGVWASSVTRNQITAFIAGVAVMFVLTFVGLDPLLVGLPPRLGAIAGALGVLAHFTGIARGVIDLRDAVYFLSLAA